MVRYGAAAILAALAEAARLPLHSPTFIPFITFVPFMLVAAGLGGAGPGCLTTVLCTLEAIYFNTEPLYRLRVADPRHWFGIAVLALTGIVASILFERLARSERRQHAAWLELATIQDHVPVMLLVVDEDLHVCEANSLAVRFSGKEPADILGLCPGPAIGCLNALADPGGCGHGPDCTRCTIRLTVSDTLLHGTPHAAVEAWVPVVVDGAEQMRCLLLSTVPMELEGMRRTILICALDITGQKQAETDLRRQGQLIDLAHDAIIVAGENRVIKGWNTGAAEMYGWTQQEATGNVIHQLLRTANVSIHEIDEVLQRCGRWDGELMQTRQDGTPIVVESRQILLRDSPSNTAGILEVNRDITGRKQAEEEIRALNANLEQRVRDRTSQLEAANHELESFAYSVSHDLRAPLRGIDGWSLALMEDFGAQLDEEARHYLGRVRSEAQHMGRLIDDLLKLSRIARAPLERDSVDLTELAAAVAGRLREAHADRQIEFAIQPGIRAQGDAQLLEVALTNLMDNAVKFTSKRPDARIEFHQTAQAGQPVLCVRDNGVGFDMSYARSLFCAFQRLHRASEFPGSGIGLATVQRVIHRHGGRVWAEAKPGEGASFYFTLGETVDRSNDSAYRG